MHPAAGDRSTVGTGFRIRRALGSGQFSSEAFRSQVSTLKRKFQSSFNKLLSQPIIFFIVLNIE